MTQQLPHYDYVKAVVTAFVEADLSPENWWAEGGDENRYDPDSAACMLTAHLGWDSDTPGLHRSQRYGIGLLWEHPVETWLWGVHDVRGFFRQDPQLLPALPRWAAPEAVVATVRELLAAVPITTDGTQLWSGHEAAQEAVDEWARREAAEAAAVLDRINPEGQ